MKDLFIAIFNMSIMASIVACVVMVIRLPLIKAPKIFSYVLWIVVLFRLVCPFTFESAFSPIPSAPDIFPQNITARISQSNADKTEPDGNTAANHSAGDITNADVASIDTVETLMEVAPFVWLAGIAVLLAYSLISYIRLKLRIKTATLVKINMYETIYETDRISTPFVLGFIEPKIYLPIGIKDIECVINHEEEHIRRRDYLIKPVALLALCLHWFNPIIWLSYFQMCKDMEMSCDERVLKRSEMDIRKNYSGSLLALSVKQSGLAIPLAFGESNVKTRIKHVLKYKRAPLWISIAAVIAVLCVTTVLASTRAQSEPPGMTSAPILSQTEMPAPVVVDLSKRSISDGQLKGMVDSGEIPQNVTELYLGSNNISDLTPLQSLTNLRLLDLYKNHISDLTPLQLLTNLQVLYLCDSGIVDVTPLQSMTNLRALWLQNNYLIQNQKDSLREALPNCEIAFEF